MKNIFLIISFVLIIGCARVPQPIVVMSVKDIDKVYSEGSNQFPIGSVLDPRGISMLKIKVQNKTTTGSLEYIGRWPLFGAPLATATATSDTITVSIGVNTNNSVKAWDRFWGGIKDLALAIGGYFVGGRA
jgi:hypothetical protein